MKNYTIALLIFAFSFLFHYYAFSQGCSDAGFCTINTLEPGLGKKITKSGNNQLNFGLFAGDGYNAITVYGNYLEYNRTINDKFGLGARFTTLGQVGNGISAFGVGDILVNGSYRINHNLTFTLGAKIPLTNSNVSEADASLPLEYQSSLGTYDIIAGIGYTIKKIQFVVAIQQPLTQNENRFNPDNFSEESRLSSFPATNEFIRKADVLLRVSYPVQLGSKFKLTPSILPIYHLENDQYTDQNNVRQDIEGSAGLTFNATLFLDYEINAKNSIQLNMGRPLIAREVRPDGLTRSFIANVEYSIRF